jgi:DNA-binding MarR family transcriptional regulator
MRHDPRTASTIELQLARLVRGLEAVRRIRPSGTVMDRAVYVLLDRLSGGPRPAAQLGSELHLDQSTVSRQLASLTRLGLARRAPDPDGGRAGVIELTDLGRQAWQDERTSRADRIGQVLHDWDEPDRRDLARLITRLNDSIDARIHAIARGEPPTASHARPLREQVDVATDRSRRRNDGSSGAATG